MFVRVCVMKNALRTLNHQTRRLVAKVYFFFEHPLFLVQNDPRVAPVHVTKTHGAPRHRIPPVNGPILVRRLARTHRDPFTRRIVTLIRGAR